MSRSFTVDASFPDRAGDRSDGASLAQVGAALRRRWRWIAGPTLIALLAMTTYVQVATPRYTAEAKILLESRDTYYTRPTQDRGEPVQLIDEQAVASQVQVVTSRDLAREAVRRLGLVGKREFDPLVDGIGPVKRVLISLGFLPDPLDRDPEDRVVDTYLEHLLVYAVGKSRILNIEFRSRDPELAAKGANTAAEVYLESQEAAKSDTARSASNWLGSNVAALRTRVAEAENKVEEFRARMGLFGAGGTTSNPIGTQQLGELSTQLSQARSAQADSQAKARLIKELIQSGRTFEIPEVANNELIRRLIEQRVNLRTQLALELRTLLPLHPRIKELNAQLTDLESQIRGAAERTVRTLETDAKIAGARVESLQAAVDGQKKVVAQANESEVQLRALERDARVQREQLESYMGRFREAAARDVGSAAPADARIVSRAVIPDTPSFPKKIPMIALASLAALVFASGAIVMRELLATPRPVRRRAPISESEAQSPGAFEEEFEPERTEVRTAAPATGRALVPYAAPDEAGRDPAPARGMQLMALAPPDERFDFEALIGRLESATAGDRRRRILATACDRGDSTEDLALALGRLLALRSRVLLIEFDGHEGDDRPGITDLVAGNVSFGEVIAREAGSRLHRIGPGHGDPASICGEAALVDLALAAYDQTYDWVICLVRDPGVADGQLLSLVAGRVHAAVIVSERDSADPVLVDLYDRVSEAGAPDVIVAREEAVAGEMAEAV